MFISVNTLWYTNHHILDTRVGYKCCSERFDKTVYLQPIFLRIYGVFRQSDGLVGVGCRYTRFDVWSASPLLLSWCSEAKFSVCPIEFADEREQPESQQLPHVLQGEGGRGCNELLGLLESVSTPGAWISNYIHDNVWDEIMYPFPNFNAAVGVWGNGISNFIHPTLYWACDYLSMLRLKWINTCYGTQGFLLLTKKGVWICNGISDQVGVITHPCPNFNSVQTLQLCYRRLITSYVKIRM